MWHPLCRPQILTCVCILAACAHLWLVSVLSIYLGMHLPDPYAGACVQLFASPTALKSWLLTESFQFFAHKDPFSCLSPG